MKNLLIIVFFVLSVSTLFSQIIPSYPERNITGVTDSLKRTISIDETEGAINPREYFVGPGDILSIVIKGIDELQFEVAINHEGIIIIPKTGVVSVLGLTLEEARLKIVNEINQRFRNVEVFVSLIQFRKIKVSLLGAVKKPSNLIFKSNARLFDVVTSSEGLLPEADIRNIRIINGDNIKYYDLLKFMRLGDITNNPRIIEGDNIFIKRFDKSVSIYGSIAFPGIYEFIENESIEDLINLSGGFLHRARTDTIEIIRFTPDFRSQTTLYYSFNEIKSKKPLLKNGDVVIVREKAYYMESHLVSIEGLVLYPGYYKIVEDKTTLKDIIEQAGGFRKDASLTEAKLYRHIKDEIIDPEFERLKLIPRVDMTDDEYDYFKAKTRQRQGKMVVDFYKLFVENDETENILLKADDIINIPEETYYVTMIGQVSNPGKIVFNPSYKIKDYIEFAGGFAWRALERKVRLIKGNTGEWIDADDVKFIEPGDIIWIPEDPPGPTFWEIFTESLTILGQVASIVAATIAVIIATR